MIQPSKHRRLAATDHSRSRYRHHLREFSFYRTIVGRRDDDPERARTPWQMSWEHIHQFFVAPILHANRSDLHLVDAFLDSTEEARRYYGHLIIIVSALSTAVVHEGSNSSESVQKHHCSDLLELLQLFEQLHERLFTNEMSTAFDDNEEDKAASSDAFTAVLRLCLAVEFQWQPPTGDASGDHYDDAAADWGKRFRRDGTQLLKRMAPDAIVGAMRAPHVTRGTAADVMRYWCLGIVKWSCTDSVHHRAQCQAVLERLARPIKGLEFTTESELDLELYLGAALASFRDGAEETKQICLYCCNMEPSNQRSTVHALFQFWNMQPDAEVCAACAQHMIAKLHESVLQSDYDAALCLFLIANQVGSAGSLSGSASVVYKALVSTLCALSNGESELTLEVTRALAPGMDALLRGGSRMELISLSDDPTDPHPNESLRDMVKALMKLLLASPRKSQHPSTTTANFDVESLLYSDPRNAPIVACARVLVVYLEIALRQVNGAAAGCKAPTNLHQSALDSTNETDCIPMDDIVNICLVLMDSKNEHVVEAIVSGFLCRMWQRGDEGVGAGRAILTKRPDLLPSTAVVVKRLHGTCAVGRSLAKDMSEAWLVLCTCSYDDNFTSWIRYVFVRQEVALNVLVSLCHDRATSHAALQTLLALSEEASNLRLLARQPGLMATLIRLLRDGAATFLLPDDSALAADADRRHLLDRDFIKERILVLAEVL